MPGRPGMDKRCVEQKTWQVYNFGKSNVFRLDLNLQRGFLSERKGKVIPCWWTKNRKDTGNQQWRVVQRIWRLRVVSKKSLKLCKLAADEFYNSHLVQWPWPALKVIGVWKCVAYIFLTGTWLFVLVFFQLLQSTIAKLLPNEENEEVVISSVHMLDPLHQ